MEMRVRTPAPRPCSHRVTRRRPREPPLDADVMCLAAVMQMPTAIFFVGLWFTYILANVLA
jgi:hypothetical protein